MFCLFTRFATSQRLHQGPRPMRASMNGLRACGSHMELLGPAACGGDRTGHWLMGPRGGHTVRANEELAQYVVPSVSDGIVRELWPPAGASIVYVTSPDAARQAEPRSSPVLPTSSDSTSRPRFCRNSDKFPSGLRGGEPRRPATPRWRSRCGTRSLPLQGPARSSLGRRRGLLRLRYELRNMGGHRAAV
jgi:hypothetical protein